MRKKRVRSDGSATAMHMDITLERPVRREWRTIKMSWNLPANG